MKVYFGCSAQRILEYKELYLSSREAVLRSGNTLTRDWIEEAIKDAQKQKSPSDRSHLYDDVMRAIIEADITIFDCSVPGMSVGHQITFAMDHYKPTLVLMKKGLKPSTSLFLAGAKSPYLTFTNYDNKTDCAKIVANFLKQKEPTSRVRVNLVLDRELDNFVEWVMFKRKISKTDAIRNMIRSALTEDKEYHRYLNSAEK